MKAYSITLRGPAARGSTVSASALHGLFSVLLEACQGALRLAFELRSSAATDAAPLPLERIADFDLVGIEGGSTRLMVQARPLGDILPELPVRFVGVDTTAFDLFLAGLGDAVRAEPDSERYDVPLLEVYGKLGSLLALGFEEIELGGEPPCLLNAEALQSIAMLKRRVPTPRQVRVAGRIEPVLHDGRAFTMRLADGVVHGLVGSHMAQEQLAELFGARVVVSGLAVFRPSGTLLRLEARHIDVADERASVWEQMPRPLFEAAEPGSSYRVRQEPSSGLAAIMGKWPGDETDEEIEAILEHLS